MMLISPKIAAARGADAVDTPSLAYSEMALDWDIVTDFLGSTRTLRDLRTKWLPKMKKESSDNYQRRIELSYLYPMFRDTVAKVVSRPFSREVQLDGELPERLAPMARNIDGRGMSITQQARSLFFDAVAYGKSHVLVEFPAKATDDETDEDQEATGKAPYFTLIPATELIAWSSHVAPSGAWVLDEIRFREQEIVPRGTYSEQARQVIRVIRADGTWQKWSRELRSNAPGNYKLETEGAHTYPGIPLHTVYLQWTDWLCARPPMLDLAWLNQAHFRAYSRQLWHEEFLRTPVFMRTGWSEDELRNGVDIGASEGIGSTAVDAKAAWIEATGSSAIIGRDGIKAIEDRAEVLGHQHMVSRTGDIRATAVAVDEAKTDNNVQAWIRATEMTLRQAFESAATFVGAEIPEDFGVNIWSEFPIEARASTDIPLLLQARREGAIPDDVALAGMKLRGLLPSDLDVAVVAAQLKEAGERRAMTNLGMGGLFAGAPQNGR